MEEVNISSTERINGKVKVFYGNKGYGFFEYDGNQLFFHVNQMIKRKRRIRKGDNASFVVIETESGIQAGEILFEDAESFADAVTEDAVTLLEIAEKENATEVQETASVSEDKEMITAADEKGTAAETKKEKTAKKSRSKKKKTETKETEIKETEVKVEEKTEDKTEDKKEEKIEEKTEGSQKKSAYVRK